jgi:hypothetical protein
MMESNTSIFSKINSRWTQNTPSSARTIEPPRVRRSEKKRIAKWFLLREVITNWKKYKVGSRFMVPTPWALHFVL